MTGASRGTRPPGSRCPERSVLSPGCSLGFRWSSWLTRRGSTATWFDPAATAAGLEDLSPHDLRHTAASLLVASGANVEAVQRMLGHASAAMTLDVYSGLFDDDLGALAERMDATHISEHPVGVTWARLKISDLDTEPSRL
ncbi:tyrosine-type recombinase/integrase [Geodermatophilus sp. SYSU D00703]